MALYQYSEELRKFIDAVGQGMGVTRDIGDSDPVRTSPINIAQYLKDRETDWNPKGIHLQIEEVMNLQEKYPMAFVVNRATIGKRANKGIKRVSFSKCRFPGQDCNSLVQTQW